MAEPQISGREPDSADDKDIDEVLMECHEVFLSTLRSRLTKLQVSSLSTFPLFKSDELQI